MKKLTIIALSSLLLGSCSVGPDYKAPESNYSGQWYSSASENASEEQAKLDWWTVFNDPLLEKYIGVAAENNKDVQIAMANLRRSRALRQEAGSAFFPSVDASGQGNRSKSSEAAASNNNNGGGQIRNLYDAGFDASWELDIFGGTRRSVEAADARVGSATADYQGVMLSTLSEVARVYYETRGIQKRINVTEENTKLLQQTFELINSRQEAGEASEFDLSRARSEYQLTQARLPNLQADLQASIFNLSVLLGQPPEALLAEMQVVEPLPVAPDIVPVGLRTDILRRRPDIRLAERELAASVADIGVETADLFPKFFLTGDIGSQARVFGDLFTASGGVWSIASLIQWSVFDGGAIRSRIKAREAESEAALLRYEKAVLEALADVETALTRYGRELETEKQTEAGVQSRRKAVALARELFDAGEEDYFAVLDAERQLTASEDDLVISETQAIIKLIALYTALGGGWELYDTADKQE